MNTPGRTIPIWGVLSVVLTPLAALFAALSALIAESLIEKPEGLSMHEHIPGFTRFVVLTTIAIIAAGLVSAVIASLKRERPRWLPIVGVISTICLIGVFHFLALPD